MHVETVFISVNANDFAALSGWYATLLGRTWDRHPMPSCHEWDLTDRVAFQVLDNPDQAKTAVTLLVADLQGERSRLAAAGIDVPEPTKVEGFDTLVYASFEDPEGNPVGLLDGK